MLVLSPPLLTVLVALQELSPVPPPPAPVRNHLPPVTDPYTRPDVEGFNIFDVTSMGPGLSSHHPDFPPPASLLAEERVRREQLGGSNCAIYQGPNTKLRPFDSHRLTPIASLNIGCTTPGQSWIWCGLKGYRVLELGKLVAVFVKDVEDEKGYNWKSFGLHRVVFIGAPQPGEFSRLAEEKQSAVIDAFDAHWRDKKFWGQTSGLAGEHVRGVPEALQLVAEARAKGAEMATKAVAEKHRAREGNSGLDEERSLALTPADKAEVAEAAEAAEAQAIAQLDDGWGFTSPSLEDLGKSLDKEEKSSHKVKKSFNKVAVRAQIRRDLLAGRGQHVEYACFQYIADNEEELKVVRAKRRERRGV